MDNDKAIKDQLMTRTMQQPHLATDVINSNVNAIFGNDTELDTISRVAVRYYFHHQEPLTKDVLDTLLADRVKDLAKNGVVNDDKTAIKYFKDANSYLEGKVDTSDKMTELINNYTKDKLASHAILVQAAKYKAAPHDYDLSANTAKVLAKINALDVTGQDNQVIDVFDYHDFEKEHEAFQELNKDKVPTGLSNLDEATYNGLAKGEVGLIGASSGHGKTTVLSNLSISYVKEGYNVFHISLEELASQMLLRFARISLGITPEEIFDHKGRIDTKTEKYIYKNYVRASRNQEAKLGHLSFYRTSPRTLTIDGLRQLIVSSERLSHIKYDVVVLDYPDLLLNTYNTGNESEDGGRMFQDLRKMAQDLNVVLWTATQLNRTAANQDVKDLNATEGSFRKINTVEFAGTVNNSHEEWTNGFMRIKIDKLRNRNDYSGLCLYFRYDPPTMRLRPETPTELQQHKNILNGDTSEQKMKYYKHKQDRVKTKQDRIRAINSFNQQI